VHAITATAAPAETSDAMVLKEAAP
jgi:hypothetical protein